LTESLSRTIDASRSGASTGPSEPAMPDGGEEEEEEEEVVEDEQNGLEQEKEAAIEGSEDERDDDEEDGKDEGEEEVEKDDGEDDGDERDEDEEDGDEGDGKDEEDGDDEDDEDERDEKDGDDEDKGAEAEDEKDSDPGSEPGSEPSEPPLPPGETVVESVADMAARSDPTPAPFRTRPKRKWLARSEPVRVPVRKYSLGQDPKKRIEREAAIANYMGMEIGDGATPYSGPQPWMVLVVVVVVIIAGMGLLIAMSDTGEETPSISLSSRRTGEFTYQVTVTKAKPTAGLEAFTFNLMDDFKLNYQTGKVGLQNATGVWEGIDVTWADGRVNDAQPYNDRADRAASAGGAYEDPVQAQVRIEAVLMGGQENSSYQLSEGPISVSFIDSDKNGRLTAGDLFNIQGHSGYHPAVDDHFLELRYGPEEKVVGRTKLGTKRIFAPHINLESIEDSNGTYHVKVVDATDMRNLTFFQYFLKDASGTTQQFGEIEIQYLGNEWTGIDITWDDEGFHDPSPGNGMADRNQSAGKPYTDPGQAQARIELVNSHNDSGRPLSVTFIDHDKNGKLTGGDEFLILGNSKEHKATDAYIFDIKYDLNYESAGDTRLG